MKLIVVSAFWNASDYIDKCITSVKNQNFTDFSMYLIDDMSTDDTVEKIKKLIIGDDRFKLIINSTKKYKLRNFDELIIDDSLIDDEDVIIELDGDDWVPVTIRSDPIGCFEACRLIIPLVDRPQDPTYLTIVFDVPIARAKHNLLVGKGGIVLAGLSATYETRIMIPPNELMSCVESTGGNIWEQRQQQQQQQRQLNNNAGNDVGSAMLFDIGGSSMSSQVNAAAMVGGLTSNIIQLEGEIDNVEKCLVRMLGIVAAEEKMKFVPTGIIVDVDSAPTSSTVSKADALSTTPAKKAKGGGDSNKSSPTEKTVARAVIVANTSIPSKIWRSIQRKTNTKIQRKNIREEDVAAGDDVIEPLLVNEIYDMEGDDDNDDGVNKEDTDAARPHSKFIITGKEQSVLKAAAQIEKMLGLEVGSTEIEVTVRVVNSVETSPINKGDDQPDVEGAASGRKSRKKRGKKKQPD